MNQYTLIFHNNTTEENYQKEQIDMMLSKLVKVCNLLIIIGLIASITMPINNQLPELIITLILGSPVVPFTYFMKCNQQYKKYVPLACHITCFACQIFPWVKYLIVGVDHFDMVISECCTLAFFCFIPSINFKYNCFTILLYNFARSSMHFIAFGYNPFNVIYIFFSFVLIFNDYHSMLAQKQFYLITQEHMLQNQIIDIFSKEKILITKFDKESFSFKNILINKQLQQAMKSNEIEKIIQQVQLKKQKQSLQQFLYNYDQSQNSYSDESKQFSLIGYIKNKRIKIDVMVQQFVDKIYIIKFDKLNFAPQSNSAVLYSKFIRKIRQESQNQKINILINKEIIQNLIMSVIGNYKIQITPKQVKIDFYRLFQNLGIKIYEIQNRLQDPLNSDPLILSSIFYLTYKVCKIEQVLIQRINHCIISLMGLKQNELFKTNLRYQQALSQLQKYVAIDDIQFREIRNHMQVDIHFNRSHQ